MSSFTSTRITPAGAGKTISAACRTREPWDHPRRCGENIVREPFYWYIVGSPPAYAGKTVLKHISCFLLRDHPRGCGENFRPARTACIRRGSPPRMRGKRGRRNEHIVTDMDHPRGCGENLVSPEQILHNIGSPPRMRGKHSVRVLLQQRVGITPADAGKTPLAWASAICQEDHPRGCGENLGTPFPILHLPGSPPRMRGKPEQAFMLFVTVRITPADAGKTRLCGSLSARPEDHPRGCGENFQPHHIAAFRAGSPPQVRGKP